MLTVDDGQSASSAYALWLNKTNIDDLTARGLGVYARHKEYNNNLEQPL
jgi:hypothetical protein